MNIYEGDYRKLMIVPILLVLVALFFIPNIKLGIDFQGGTVIRLYTQNPVNITSLSNSLTSNGLKPRDIKQIDTQIGNVIEIELSQDEKLTRAEELRGEFYTHFDRYSYLESILNNPSLNENERNKYQKEYGTLKAMFKNYTTEMFTMSSYSGSYDDANSMQKMFDAAYNKVKEDYQDRVSSAINIQYDSIAVKSVSPSLGIKFIERAASAVVWALLLSMALAFFVFRKIETSLIVFSGAMADVIIAAGGMGLFNIQLTLSSFAALIMMLGFSLDTDMLLTMRLIKQRKGTLREAAWNTLKTGSTMSITDLISFSVLLILGYITHLTTYSEIASVAVIGLLGDMIATWMFNAPLIMLMLKER
ncbi:hypothetical protein J7J90_03175 [Candidatus Micrarchaeota archaeon]|nr:hypothetical protein [Candidatus Micrarchaeota archaeon]